MPVWLCRVGEGEDGLAGTSDAVHMHEGFANILGSLLFPSPFFSLFSGSIQASPGLRWVLKVLYLLRFPQPHTHTSLSCWPNYLLIACQDVCFSGGSLERV